MQRKPRWVLPDHDFQTTMLDAQVGRDITAFVKTNSNTMTPEQEREMVRKYESGETQISLDLKYNINQH